MTDGMETLHVRPLTRTLVFSVVQIRDVRTAPADTDPEEFLRSSGWCGRLAPKNSRTQTDADH